MKSRSSVNSLPVLAPDESSRNRPELFQGLLSADHKEDRTSGKAHAKEADWALQDKSRV